MEQSIEEFKKKIIESKQSTISLDDICLFNDLFRVQNQYGSDYKPKRRLTLFGYKEVCPNCLKEMQTKYFGQERGEGYSRYVQFYVKQCTCGYEYAYTELTLESKSKVPRSNIMDFAFP